LILFSLGACKRKEKKGEDKVFKQYKQYALIVKNYGVAPFDSTKLAVDTYLQTFPTDARAWAFLGRLYYDMNKLNEALAAYHQAIQLNPNMPEGYSGAGAIHGILDRTDSSIYYLTQALQHKDSSAYTFLNLAIQYTKTDTNKLTITSLVDSSLTKQPTASVYAGLSFVMEKIGNSERSSALFDQAKAEGLKDTLGFVDVLSGKQKLYDYYLKNNY